MTININDRGAGQIVVATAKTNKSVGLGDTVAKVTKAVGIKPCGGCKKRQQKFNKMFPYKEDT